MNNTLKTTSGKLLDVKSKEILTDCSVELILVKPKSAKETPKYKVSMTVKKYRPDLDQKAHILQLEDKISGEVFVSIKGIPSSTQTTFEVFLQDSVWNNLEWFQNS